METVEAQAEASHAEETPAVAPMAPQRDSEPSEPEDPIEESPDEPEDEHGEEGYTSASHSYHPSDSEGYSDGEEALQAELASKEDEHDKLASQLQLMQQEMEALRKMLEQNQQELATSSQESSRWVTISTNSQGMWWWISKHRARWRCFRAFLKNPQVSLFVLFDWESFFVDWPLKLKFS